MALDLVAGHVERLEWDDAIDILQQVLDLPEDQFLAAVIPTSAKDAASARLSALPVDGRQRYDRRYAAAAEALLAVAERTGSLDPLRGSRYAGVV